MPTEVNCVAFEGARLIAKGPLADVALAVRATAKSSAHAGVLVFDADTSEPVEIDVRGSEAAVLARLRTPAPRGPGRPRLGVIPREVTLLPRHWDWLATQPGGASVTLRRLVDRARTESVAADRVRQAQEATYRFMVAMAGDRPGFEEATRALYRGNAAAFRKHVQEWPADIQAHVLALMERTRHA